MSMGPVHASVFITGRHPEEASHIDKDYDDSLSRAHRSIPLCTFISEEIVSQLNFNPEGKPPLSAFFYSCTVPPVSYSSLAQRFQWLYR